jgi:hypothetical protein
MRRWNMRGALILLVLAVVSLTGCSTSSRHPAAGSLSATAVADSPSSAATVAPVSCGPRDEAFAAHSAAYHGRTLLVVEVTNHATQSCPVTAPASVTLTNSRLPPLTVALHPRADVVLPIAGVGVLTVGAAGRCPHAGETGNPIYRTVALTWRGSRPDVVMRHVYLDTECGHVTASGLDLRP